MNESPRSPSSSPFVPVPFWKHLSGRGLKEVGASLRQKDFQYFLGGSFLSNIGGWMQSVAQAWLVLQMTNSPFYLGLDGFANSLPIAVFAFWGGVIADRVERRRMLILTQWILLALAFVLGLLVQLKAVRVWEVIAFSFCTGLTQAVAWPVYQTVMANLVPRQRLSNAIALNSTQFNTARMIGPLLGALGLSLFGTAGCFFANAASFLAVIAALKRVAALDNRRDPSLARIGFIQSFREGWTYMTAARPLLWLLLLMGAASLLGVPMVTLLPFYARDILKIGASGLGVLVGAFGAGAVAAGLLAAFLGDFPQKGRFVMISVFIFVAGMMGFSFSQNLLVSVLCLFLGGFSMVGFASVINTIIQGSVPDSLRGRAMSLFVFSFGGCMPFGNLSAGFFAKLFGAPRTLFLQGAVLGVFTLYVYGVHPEVCELS